MSARFTLDSPISFYSTETPVPDTSGHDASRSHMAHTDKAETP